MRNKGTVQSHVPQHKRSENIQKIIMTTISIIVAIDEENGIGKDNQLLCRLPNDMKRFEIKKSESIGFGGNSSIWFAKRCDGYSFYLSSNPDY